MVPADKRRYPTPAKAAVALLADYCFLQNLWGECGGGSFANRRGDSCDRRVDVSNW